MSVDGTWKIAVKAPMGTMETELRIQSEDGVLKGVQEGQGQRHEVEDGRVDGDQITWANTITSPMKIKLVFNATVTGDTMAGKVKAGPLGSISFKGIKQAASV
jgi:2,4-diaminopentanoate dehydrogenase